MALAPPPTFDPDDSSELEDEIEAVIGARPDLVPSVRKIIEAGEPKPVASHALKLFAAALAQAAEDPSLPNPNRNPATALGAAKVAVGKGKGK